MRILLTLCLALLLAACTPVVYTPASPTIPLLDDAGQIAAELSASTSSYGGSVAWSPIRHGYVHAAGAIFDESEDTASHFRFAEAGVGFYHPLVDGTSIDLAAAHGLGYASDLAHDPDPLSGTRGIDRIEYGDYRRTWLQGSLGWMSTSENGGWEELVGGGAIALRYSWVSFDELTSGSRIHHAAADGSDSAGAWSIAAPREASGVFREITVVGRAGVAPLMGDIRLSFAKGVDSSRIAPVPIAITLGVRARLDLLF